MPSAAFVAAALAQRTDLVLVTCLTVGIAGSAPEDKLYLCDHPGGVTRDIDDTPRVFTHAPFGTVLPADAGDSPPRARLVIANVNRALIESLRTLNELLYIRLEIVTLDDPDTVEIGPMDFTAADFGGNASDLELELGPEDVLNIPYPGVRITPNNAPGFF